MKKIAIALCLICSLNAGAQDKYNGKSCMGTKDGIEIFCDSGGIRTIKNDTAYTNYYESIISELQRDAQEDYKNKMKVYSLYDQMIDNYKKQISFYKAYIKQLTSK
jgi:hypothetical protein